MVLVLRMKEVSHEVADSTRVYVATHYHVTKGVLIIIVSSAKIPLNKKRGTVGRQNLV